MGGVSVGDEMSPRQNAQTHTRFLHAHKALEARATSGPSALIVEPAVHRSFS